MAYRVVYSFDPFEIAGLDKPRNKSVRRDALEEIADYVKTEMLQYIGEGKSPVQGGEWQRKLSKAYAEAKAKVSSAGFANMELTGDMLDALDFKIKGDGTIEIGWFGGENAAKAHGHQNGNDDTNLPVRQLVPDKKQTFRKDIVKGMKEIADAFSEDE